MEKNPFGIYKFVIVLNEKTPIGNLISAAAQITMSLYKRAPEEVREQMNFKTFHDADNNEHADLSLCSVVILKGKDSQLKTLRAMAKEQKILCSAFTHTMTFEGISEDLHEKTKKMKEEELTYFGVGLFGSKDEINLLTKKFSLWK